MNAKLSDRTVVIDARMVGPTLHGIARYVTLMAEGLSELQRASGRLPYQPVFLVDPKGYSKPDFAGFPVFPVDTPFLALSEQFGIPLALRKLKASLYHSPSFASLIYCPCPWVITVHDLNHLTYGSPAERQYYRWVLRPFARRAKELLSISRFSRREISEWTGIPEDRIGIVANSLDPSFASQPQPEEIQPVLAKFGLTARKYFLCLSNPKPHKNVAFLVEAYRKARETVPDLWPLVLSLKGIADPARDRDRVLELNSLNAMESRALMAGAGALLFPSLYEGFGLPPVEATALGTPVVVSRIPAHQEALEDLVQGEGQQDSILWVDPQGAGVQEGWIEAIHRVFRGECKAPSQATREKLIRRYSVRAMGDSMDRIYRCVLRV